MKIEVGFVNSYIIPLPPIGKTKNGRHVTSVFYSREMDKEVTKIYIRSQHGNLPTFHSPITLDVTFFTNPTEDRHFIENTYNTKTPTGINLYINLLECMKGIVFTEEKWIVNQNIKKYNSKNDRTEILLTVVR